jgi:hypothetical protein
MNSSPLLALAAAFLVAGLTAPACAQSGVQWKWRDARGQVQYSDLPPPKGTPDADILQRPRAVAAAAAAAAASAAEAASEAAAAGASAAPAGTPGAAATASAPDASASGVDPVLEARRKQAEQAEAAKRQAAEADAARLRVANCERARGQLRLLDSGQRVARMNENGERVFVDDTTRARESAEARRAISVNCR